MAGSLNLKTKFSNPLKNLLKAWYGDFSKQELKKYLLLGLTFALILSSHWTLRVLKDTIFGGIVMGYGKEIIGMKRDMFLGFAKVISLLLLIPLLVLYSKLVDIMKKHHLLYALGIFYIFSFLAWTYFFLYSPWGLTNCISSPWRLSGWLWYIYVESFGTLFITIFWAFVVDISDQKSAQRGFAIIVMMGQLGGVIIPKIFTKIPSYFGISTANIIALCSLLIFFTLLLIYYFRKIITPDQLQGYKPIKSKKTSQESEPNFLEGLKLLVSKGYLLGICAIVSFYEIIITIIDYNFTILALKNFQNESQALAYLGSYASTVNIAAFICLAFGINNIQRRLGMKIALSLIPLIIGSAIIIFFLYPELNVLFYILVVAKAVNHSLNGPAIKQLYIPTSENVRYKTQAWIEVFGNRGAKASASFLNISKSIMGAYPYMLVVASLSLGLASLWFFIALYLSKKYSKAIDEQTYIC